jgi:hypothetical protein
VRLFVREQTMLERYEAQKFPGLARSEIEASLAGLRSVSGRFNSVTVSEPSRNCFLFSSESVP